MSTETAHKRIQEITERIRERSKPTREAYLDRVREAALQQAEAFLSGMRESRSWFCGPAARMTRPR